MSTNTITALSRSDPEESAGSLPALLLGLLVLMYLMYDSFEKKYADLREKMLLTETRFHVVEDKLATLDEVEDDVKGLKEVEEERKNSWEDDVTEPNKHQALIGTGKWRDYDIEIRLIFEKFNTFKSNRYWLMNDHIPYNVIQHILDSRMINGNFEKKEEKLVSTMRHMAGIDGILNIQCVLPSSAQNDEDVGTARFVSSLKKEDFKWKHLLVDLC